MMSAEYMLPSSRRQSGQSTPSGRMAMISLDGSRLFSRAGDRKISNASGKKDRQSISSKTATPSHRANVRKRDHLSTPFGTGRHTFSRQMVKRTTSQRVLQERLNSTQEEAEPTEEEQKEQLLYDSIAYYVDATWHSIARRNKKGSISGWKEVISILGETSDYEALCTAHQILGEIYLDYKDIELAIQEFTLQKNFAEQTGFYASKIKAYENLGLCHQQMKDYRQAIIYFKKALELAWLENDEFAELDAYDSLAMQFYYIGDMDRAAYYHDRAMRGKIEDPSSYERIRCRANLTKRLEERANRILKLEQKEKKDLSSLKKDLYNSFVDEKELPSPRGMSHGGSGEKKTFSLLPHFPNQNTSQRTLEKSLLNKVHQFNKTLQGLTNTRSETRIKPFQLLKKQDDKAYKVTQNSARLAGREVDTYDIAGLRRLKMKPSLNTGVQRKKTYTSTTAATTATTTTNNTPKEFQPARREIIDPNLPENIKKFSLLSRYTSQTKPKEYICINHLSPNRSINNFRNVEDINYYRTKQKFDVFKRDLYSRGSTAGGARRREMGETAASMMSKAASMSSLNRVSTAGPGYRSQSSLITTSRGTPKNMAG